MKRNISEIFDNLTPGTSEIIGQYGIETDVDEVTKRRIYNNVMDEINARKSAMPTTGKKKFNKVAVIAAACIAAMTIGGISAGADTLYKKFTDYKSSYTEVQKATINEARFPINKQASFEGITFTVTEGMRDERMIYLIINAECDPEITGSTKDKVISLSSETSVGDCVYSETLAHEGDTYTILAAYETGNGIDNSLDVENGQEVDVLFNDVSLYIPAIDSATGEKNLCENLWAVSRHNNPVSLSFIVSKQKANFGKQFHTELQIPFMAHDTDIDLGYISPWYGKFSLYSKGDEYNAVEIDNGTPDMKITMNNGKVYTSDNGINIFNSIWAKCGTNKHEGAYVCRWDFSMTFDEYIDTVNIESIEINGVEVNIENIDLSKHYAGLDYYWSTEY